MSTDPIAVEDDLVMIGGILLMLPISPKVGLAVIKGLVPIDELQKTVAKVLNGAF